MLKSDLVMEVEQSRWQLAYDTISHLMSSVEIRRARPICEPLIFPMELHEISVSFPIAMGAESQAQGQAPTSLSQFSAERRQSSADMVEPGARRSRFTRFCCASNRDNQMNAATDRSGMTDYPCCFNSENRCITCGNTSHFRSNTPENSCVRPTRTASYNRSFRDDGFDELQTACFHLPNSSDISLAVSENSAHMPRTTEESEVEVNGNSISNNVNVRDLFHRLMENFYMEAFLWIYVNTLLHPVCRQSRNRIRFLAAETGRSFQQAISDILSGFLNGYQHSRLPLITEIDRSLREISVDTLRIGETSLGQNPNLERAIYFRQLSMELGTILNLHQMLESFGSVVREVTMQTIVNPLQHQRRFSPNWNNPAVHQYSLGSPNYFAQSTFPACGAYSWQLIPPPPPPYPGFLLHFLAMLDQPLLPSEVPDEYYVNDFDTYEALTEVTEEKSFGLTDDAIQKLPVYAYKAVDDAGISVSDQEMCVICLGHFDRCQLLRVLPCGHDYHVSCVDRWLKMKNTCPVCRSLVGSNASVDY